MLNDSFIACYFKVKAYSLIQRYVFFAQLVFILG